MEHPLRGLLVAQFFGAFNDNAWKILLSLLGMTLVQERFGMTGPVVERAAQDRAALALLVFTLPLILFSLPAGVLADRLGKRTVIVSMKGLEIVLMAAGTVALLQDPRALALPLVVLGLMGVQSALFSPAKYGILPEVLPHERLSRGNALLETWTFLAIIAGTASAGALMQATGGKAWWVGACLVGFSLAGFAASLTVPRVPPARSEGGFLWTVSGSWTAIRTDRVLWLTVIGVTWFWAVVSLLGQDILVYAKVVLALDDTATGSLLALFGIGVGAGSLLAGRLSASKVEYGLIPLGSVLFCLFASVLAAAAPGYSGTLLSMLLLGAASGLLAVPLNAVLQWRSPPERRGGVIALSNVFAFTGVFAGSLAGMALARTGLSPRGILAGAAALTLGGTAWALTLLPDALLRLVLVLLTHTFYRLEVRGRRRVPRSGGALLVPNHVSFVDGLFLMSSLDRRIRFVVDASYFDNRLLRPFMRSLGAIPVSATGGPRVILRALREAGRLLDEGEVVCVFAEGQITRTGSLLPFRRGMERIVKGRAACIVPVNLDRVWGSIFSRARGRFLFKVPERVPYPITVSFGEPLPAGTPIHQVRRAVLELGERAWEARRKDRPPLHHTWIRASRRRPWRLAFSDSSVAAMSRIGAVIAAVALARALRAGWEGQERVGILLPPSAGGALANLAASLAGRTSVNLNYTAGAEGMASAARQAGLRTVVTSREFLDRARVSVPEGARPVLIEEVREKIGRGGRCLALFLAWGAPVRRLERLCGAARPVGLDDVATIIFSSGSTGEPKGVLLSHYNLDSNVEAAAQVLRTSPDDRALGTLPFFHSFGTFLLWYACNHGVPVVFHPNPLDATAVGEIVEHRRITILVTTPTFLQIYLRRIEPARFGSLRLVIVGAEKLPERLALAFEEKFGIRPLEGYGTTECSPVVAVSTPSYRGPGVYQPASRRGSVGLPLPGVAVRIVDPQTGETLPPGEEGMVLVRGPNVMRGYLGREDLDRESLRDGWYVTGDVGTLDEEGFLSITDRLSRFSKIGGEMVPHGRVEQALQEAAGLDHQVFAVTSVSDAKKGERLAVLHTLGQEEIPAVLRKAAEAGLPNLFLPRAADFVRVEELPRLGTGKLDLRQVRRVAREALEAGPRAAR